MQTALSQQAYEAHNTVPATGIYSVHHAEQRAYEELALIRSDSFPICDVCADAVRYQLVRAVPSIFEDEDFKP